MRPFGLVMSLLSAQDRRRLVGLIALILLSGLVEVVGVGFLLPYVALLQDPQRVKEMRYLKLMFDSAGFQSLESFLIAVSVALFALVALKGILTVWVTSAQLRFVYMKQADLGRRLLEKYLRGDYQFFVQSNSSVLIGNLTTSVGQVCAGIIQSSLALVSEVAVTGLLVVLLVSLSSLYSLFAIAFIGVLATVFLKVVRRRISRLGEENDKHLKAMIRTVNEAIGGAKELQVLGREQFYVDAYWTEATAYAAAVRRYTVLSQVPRVVLETAAVAGMVVFAILAIGTGNLDESVFPVLAVFAVAAVRLVPSANRILQSWAAIGFLRPALEVVASSLGGLRPGEPGRQISVQNVPFKESLRIRIDAYTHPQNETFRLHDIDIEIRRGQKVALIGHSGSGKSTLVDILMGLYPAFEGGVFLDGQDVSTDLEGWRRRVGYIPQTVFLADASIMRNVAFGLTDREIDAASVADAVRLAGLEDLLRTLADGLETVVGDRGIRQSGGERQRIGIARALYLDPEILVLDEATSALDNETEKRIVESILGLSPAKTIIVIAHRLSTVKHCDVVHLMNEGTIVDSGSFDELSGRHPDFMVPGR